MTYEIKGGEALELSTDINVITAEINAYQLVAGEAIFEIGKRVHQVKYNPKEYGLPEGRNKEGRTIVARGAWGEFLESVNMNDSYARKFETIYIGIVGNRSTLNDKGMSALYEIATMSMEQQEQTHTIPSTGIEKTVDEMTVRELREVKRELKKTQAERDAERRNREQAEAQAKVAQRSEELMQRRLEEVERVPEVEIRTQYVEIPDEQAQAKIQRYEELFGDVSMYDGQTTRVTNGDAITYTVFEFTEDVRKFIEKYGHLTHFASEFSAMIDEGKCEYRKTISDMRRFLTAIERSMDEEKTIIIDG